MSCRHKCESEQCVSLRAEADTAIAGRHASTARHDAAAADMTAQLQSEEVSGAQKLKAALEVSSSLSSTNADLSHRIADLEKQVKAVSSDRDSLLSQVASAEEEKATLKADADAAAVAACQMIWRFDLEKQVKAVSSDLAQLQASAVLPEALPAKAIGFVRRLEVAFQCAENELAAEAAESTQNLYVVSLFSMFALN